MAPEFRRLRALQLDVTQGGLHWPAGLEDYTQIWWDAPHPPGARDRSRCGPSDAQSDVRRAAALAALVHCLTRARGRARARPASRSAREALAESSFQATRHGLDAELLDRDGEPGPGAASWRAAASRWPATVAGGTRRLGSADSPVERIRATPIG